MWSGSHLKRRKNRSKIRMTSFLLRRQTFFFLFCFSPLFSVQVLKYCSMLLFFFFFSPGWLYVCLFILIFCVYPPVLSGWAVSHKAPCLPRYVKSQATATCWSPWEWGVLWVAGEPGSNEAPEEQGSPVPLLDCQGVSSIPGVVNTENPPDASHLGLCIQRIMVFLFSFFGENSSTSLPLLSSYCI